MAHDSQQITLDLTTNERELLCLGLMEWGGGAKCTEQMAIAMGFESFRDLCSQSSRIISALDGQQPLTRWDWTRALLATEIIFISDVVGLGSTWNDLTNLDDVLSFKLLRQLQTKMLVVRVRIGPEAHTA